MFHPAYRAFEKAPLAVSAWTHDSKPLRLSTLPNPQPEMPPRRGGHRDTCWWLHGWLLSFEALDQSRHSCQVPCREFDVVLSSGTRFTHETGDFLASKSHVEPVFRQVTRYDAERPERCVLVERPLGTEITGVGFDAKSQQLSLPSRDSADSE